MKFNIKFLFIVFLLVFAFSSFAYSDLRTDLVSYWKFDETSGTTASDSVGSNDGTVSGATWVSGKINNGLSFDGNNDYVEVPDSITLDITTNNAMTFNFWHYGAFSTRNSRFLFKGTSGDAVDIDFLITRAGTTNQVEILYPAS